VVKLNSTGVITWPLPLGGTGGDFGLSIQQTADGGYVVASTSASNDGDVTGNHGSFDYWVIKLSSTVGVNEVEQINTLNIHPNPTSGAITIKLNEHKSGVIRVLNTFGQIVLEEEFNNTQELDISLNEPAGVYFLQLESEGEVITNKIVKE
jgi:hypothetical protein